MKLERDDFDWAVTEGLITAEQKTALWEGLARRTGGRQRFDFAHVAYYFGAMVVISAMAWFMTEAWDELGGAGLASIGAIYAIVFVFAARHLWDRHGLRVPGGLLLTLAVWMTPIVIFGIEDVTGIWPKGDPGTMRDYHVWVRGSWIVMELGTICAGLAALRYRRFPFLTFPIAFALWYMSMDVTPLLVGRDEFSWDERAWVSVIFGGLVIVIAYLVDLRGKGEDYAFWLYFFGLAAFWGGLTSLDSDSEAGKLVYFAINLALIGVSLLLRQRIFLVAGSIGSFIYLGHLAWEIFKDSMMFPFVLSIGGLGVIALGVVYQKKRDAIEARLMTLVPGSVRAAIPERARRDAE
jgi:hypothetical protein